MPNKKTIAISSGHYAMKRNNDMMKQHSRQISRLLSVLLAFSLFGVLAACSSIGNGNVSPTEFEYGSVAGSSLKTFAAADEFSESGDRRLDNNVKLRLSSCNNQALPRLPEQRVCFIDEKHFHLSLVEH